MKTTRWRHSTRWSAGVLAGILFAAALAGCGGSAVTGNGTTAVTVKIGGGGAEAAPAAASSRATPRPLGAAIPLTVAKIRFTVSGAGMDNIVQTFRRSGATMTVTLQVPSGPGRTILVEALDEGDVSRFRGVSVIDTSGVALAVTVTMSVDPSNPALRTWTAFADTVSTSANLNRVTQGDGIVLAAGTSGEIFSSADGIGWTSRTPGNISGTISALTFGDNTFLAMTSGFVGTFYPGYWNNHFFAATSDNVAGWTLRGSVGTAGSPLADIAFGAGLFVAIGDNNAFYSPDDGATWYPGTISGVSRLSSVAYGNGRFVATDSASDNVAVSVDGIHWTTAAIGLASPETPRRTGFGGGLFLLTTSSGDVYTSTDGVAWLRRARFADLAGLDTSVARVAYGAEAFLIITASPAQVYFSVDSGDTWVALDPFGTGGGYHLDDILYWNGAYIGVGGDYVYPAFGHVFRSGDL